ncbi:histidine kinase dimerization/phosphoacceptor domain -containing protein [Cytophagaceae bacterium YF14B1]|uniref:histidine kinase n=1 Tax=Xanthocytophaga flava TaxID=3048013 RepID=A0AAE3QQD2_9BACT|nr:histidine kinase dimerization/phosphoacceptor domain -containing protein [Xanthocytophaga flavus]MDJ1480954.1 histidine kinase dimerization/phosphoacceptor domain -containing protein [Xanthocytophaga flavus]
MKLLTRIGFLLCSILLCGVLPVVAQIEHSRSYPELVSAYKKSKADTNRVQLLYDIGAYYFFNPNVASSRLDSVISMLQQAEALSIALKYPKGQGNTYRMLAMIYCKQGKPEKGKPLVYKAIQILKNNNNLADLGEAYFELGGYYTVSEIDIAERIRLSQLGLEAFTQAGNKLKQANGLKELGDLYELEGQSSKALLALKQSLKLYQSIGYLPLHGVYDLLGTVNMSLGDYKEAIRYGLLAVKTAERLDGSSMQMATIYNRLGIIYYEIKEFEQANHYFKKSIGVAQQHHDLITIHMLTANIVRTFVYLNRLEEALVYQQNVIKNYPIDDITRRIINFSNFIDLHLRLKQYKQAHYYCGQLHQLSSQFNQVNAETQIYAYDMLAIFYLATQQYKLAQKYVRIHKALAQRDGLLPALAKNYLWHFKIDSAQGNYPAAILHYQHYKALKDSLLNEAKSQQIAQLQIQYETEKKDQNIKLQQQNILLLTKQSLLKESQLKQAKLLRNITLGGVILLLIIIGLLYNRYLTKQRNSKKLEAQQKEINDKNLSLQRLVTEKEWLLKEIHHRVKNNLQIVMSLLNSQSAYINNEAAMLAIRSSQHRVQAISLIHQKLYQSESVEAIDMPVYIQELVEYLRDIFSTGQRIRFDIQIDPIRLDVSYAVPLGLILNEVITNSIKYAFPGTREGLITISFKQTHGNQYILAVMDNGVGLPANFDSNTTGSLGVSLIRGLSEDIDGKVCIESNHGTTVLVDFVYQKINRLNPILASDILINTDLPSETII